MEPRNTHLYELPLQHYIVHLLNSLWLKWPQASISALFLLHCLLWALTLDCILELYAPRLCCMIRCCQNDKELLEWYRYTTVKMQVFVQLIAILEYVNVVHTVNTVNMLYFQKELLHWQSNSYAMYCLV